MVSLDVESLFTNVPSDYTINLILERIYKNKELNILIPESDLKKLLELCTKDNILLFNGLLYQQVDGVAMGSPLGPLLANIFMSHVEKLLFNSDLKTEVNFWLQYIVLICLHNLNFQVFSCIYMYVLSLLFILLIL